MTPDRKTTACDRPTLLLVTADLFLGSRIRAVAEQVGYAVRTVPNLARELDAPAGDASRRIVVDLTTPGIDPATLSDRLGDAAERTLAYAPHVRVDLLKAARAAGIGTVLVRSRLDDELPRWLASSD